jgi:hypothetical protein
MVRRGREELREEESSGHLSREYTIMSSATSSANSIHNSCAATGTVYPLSPFFLFTLRSKVLEVMAR